MLADSALSRYLYLVVLTTTNTEIEIIVWSSIAIVNVWKSVK